MVAFGRVVEIHNDERRPHNSYALFELEGAWKGEPQSPVRIYPTDSAHGYRFREGASYLFFARLDDERATTSVCSPNCRGEHCLEHLRALGVPKRRYPGPDA
jgi:hypothetical protein